MTPLFEIKSLTHRYGSVLALDDLSLSAEPGAIGLVGQNGAGKSTLIKILLGLVRHTAGTVRVYGSDVTRNGVGLRGRIGYMPEREGVVPGLNGIEFVALAGELNGMPRKQALRQAHEILSQLGLEEARYRRLENYSAGMQQRIKLAATLVHDPDLLLLDEPTAGLDPDGRTAMLSLLTSLARRPGQTSRWFCRRTCSATSSGSAGTRSLWRRAPSLRRARSTSCSPVSRMLFCSNGKAITTPSVVSFSLRCSGRVRRWLRVMRLAKRGRWCRSSGRRNSFSSSPANAA